VNVLLTVAENEEEKLGMRDEEQGKCVLIFSGIEEKIQKQKTRKRN
jgi:hypothetical protein